MIGVDVSHWQSVINWQAAKDAIGFAILKCTQGVWQFDEQYLANQAGCELYGIPHGVYHFLEPNIDGTKQAEYFYQHVDDPSILVWVIDVEWTSDGLPVNLEKFVKRIQELTGEVPYIYTRPSVWNLYFADGMPDWAKECPLWIADPDLVTTPDMPIGWVTWEIWQYSWLGTILGISGTVDLNCINGEDWEIPLMFGNGGVVDDPDESDIVFFEALVEGQNIRSGPGLTYPIVGHLSAGDVLSLSNISGLDAWAEIALGKWAAVKIGARQYLRLKE